MRLVVLFLLSVLSFTSQAIALLPLEQRLEKHILYKKDQNLIGKIVIDDKKAGINQGTYFYVKKALDFYKEKKPIFIILELNTPGGEVYSAQKISDALKEIDIQYGIPVVTFINNWAISAGAMLAYSTRFIVIAKDAAMGAAEPVLAGQSGKMEQASEKINSALRADFANRANFFGRNADIAEAMVDKDIILVFRNQKVLRLENENEIKDSDVVITKKGKLLTLNAEQLIRYGVADILLTPTKIPLITDKEKEQGVWSAKKEPLFQAPFFREIPNATVEAYRMDFKTKFFVWLSHPAVTSLLFLGFMVGFYVEINTPGFGVPGTIGLTSLFLLLLSSFSLEIASWLELILLAFGLLCILAEVFVTPGFGLLGTIGIISFIAGFIGILIPSFSDIQFDFDTNTLNAAGQFALERLAWIAFAFILSIIVIVLLARYVLPKVGYLSNLVLLGEEDKSKGYVATPLKKDLFPIGKEGITATVLRPSGKILIDDHLLDAISACGYLEKGQHVVIVDYNGSTPVVDEINKEGQR